MHRASKNAQMLLVPKQEEYAGSTSIDWHTLLSSGILTYVIASSFTKTRKSVSLYKTVISAAHDCACAHNKSRARVHRDSALCSGMLINILRLLSGQTGNATACRVWCFPHPLVNSQPVHLPVDSHRLFRTVACSSRCDCTRRVVFFLACQPLWIPWEAGYA